MRQISCCVRASLFLLLTMLCTVLLFACSAYDNTLTVDFYKIGKADAVFIEGAGDTGTPFYVLVDTGEADDAPEIIEKVRASGADRLDCLILTHFDKDHIGGLTSVLSQIPAKRILVPDYVGEGEPYEAMMSLFGTAPDLNVEVLTADTEVSFGKTTFSVSIPKTAVYDKKQDNNSSLVITVTHGANMLLLTGDAEAERQAELMAEGLSPVTLLKVPHHGVYNKGIEDFFTACAPVYAIITCSDKNPAEQKTLDALAACGTDVYLTANGDIRVICTENGMSIAQ